MTTLEAVLTLVASNGIVLGLLGYLFQRLFDHRLSLAVEEHRVNLESLASREYTRFSNLHEKRGEVLAEVYSRLIEAIRVVESFVAPIEWAGQPTRVENYRAAASKILDFGDHFERHRIFLAPSTCKIVQDFFETVRRPVEEFWAWDFPTQDRTAPGGRFRAFREGHGLMKAHVPRAREALENKFRKVLGSTE